MGFGGKGNNSPTKSLQNLQNTEAGLLSQYSGIALPAMNTASGYWNSLLQGGPAAQAATAPYAQNIAAQTAANQKNIQTMLPAGGQKQLAEAQNLTQGGASIANLYQGLGPQAAQQLSQLGLGAAGAGTGSGQVSSNAGTANVNAKANAIGGAGQGLGALAGTILASPTSSGGSVFSNALGK